MTAMSVHAQMAQDPLLSRSAAVEPNIVFMFDDSGSMTQGAIYQYGGCPGGLGMTGPGTIVNGSCNGNSLTNNSFAQQSPDVNLMWYDPRILYSKRINADGTFLAPGSITNVNSFKVYFYKSNTTYQKVSAVATTAGGSNYPASGITATFSTPANGTAATGHVTTAPISYVSGVTVNSGGQNYAPGTTITFSSPDLAGGVRATGTPIVQTLYTVTGVTVNPKGSGYPASGVTATFSPAPAGGITATGTVTTASVTTGSIASAKVTAGGSGYAASGVTATFSAPPAGGVRATGTVTMGSKLSVGSVTVNTQGSGYPASGVTGTFTPAPSGGLTATGTPIISSVSSGSVASGTVTAGGSGYPVSGVTATLSAPPSGVTATATVTTSSVTTYSAGAIVQTTAQQGSGYNNTFSATFPVPPAGGVRATASITRNANSGPNARGLVIVLTNPGSGYLSPPVLSVTVNSGTGFTYTSLPAIATVNTSISGIAITNPGSGYTTAPAVTLGNTGTGSGATLITTLGVTNAITGFNVTNAGSGYTSAPTLTLGGTGSGSGATVTVNTLTSYFVSGISVINPGSGYTSAPSVSLGSAGGGSGATFATVLGTTYQISGVSLTPGTGTGYTSPPTLTLGGTGTGSGAIAAVTTSSTNSITGINVTNPGSGYITAPTISTANRGSGTGASFTTQLGSNGTNNYITGFVVDTAGNGYTTMPAITLSNTGTGSGATFTVTTAADGTPTVVSNKKWDGVGDPTTAVDYYVDKTVGTVTTTGYGYLPLASELVTGAASLPYPNVTGATTASYPAFRDRSDCAATGCTWAQEQQNYANWKAYHSNRINLAKTGIGLAFQPLNPTFRLGWGTINTLGGNSPALDKGVRVYSDAIVSPAATSVKTDFFTWLYSLNTNGSTPNRKAVDQVGKYYMRDDDGGPWATTSTGDGAISKPTGAVENKNHASCRRSYALLMTDGYYNDTFTLADQDSNSTALPAITGPDYKYVPVGPYSDTNSGTAFANTFADVTMKYWGNDLRPNIANSVKANDNDIAYWQHMNFYAIGLGVVGTLDQTDASILKRLTGSGTDRTLDWPTPVTDTQTAIDDMWHATVNGRGKIFNAKSAKDLAGSISIMLSDVSGAEGTQAGVAVSTVNLTSGTKKYTPSYTPITWTGNVTAYWLDSTNGAQAKAPAWQVETKLATDPNTKVSTYNSLIPSEPNRNIFVGNGATTGARAVEFKYDLMVTAGLTTLMNGTVNDGLIKYLRGDGTNEATIANLYNPSAIYRPRQNPLGDIVNSTPVFVKNTTDLKYDGVPGYRAFVDTKNARPEGMLMVGANDGMLHGFRDGTGTEATPLTPGGYETFAYVPKALLPTINQLANKSYVHRYYVDGPLIETDAYFKNGTARWANIVVGSTGGGAGAASSPGVSPRTAVFAIDMTSLNTSATSFDASNVLWEISSSTSGFSELGYVLTDVQAGPTLDGSWVGIFGNGYESATCQSILYIVNMETGAKIKEINTNSSATCGSTGKNGLGGVRIVRNANQQIIGAYAGDLQGSLWKFSLNDVSTSNWKVDMAGQPLFTAGTTQPITAQPTVMPLTTLTTPSVGNIVVVGTGKFYETTDITSITQQSLYGILDTVPFGAAVIPVGGAVLTDRSLLVQQTINNTPQTVNSTSYYSVSTNPVVYTPVSATSKRGWYIDFPNSGQRLVYPMDLLVNRYVAVDSISPANVSFDPCQNVAGGTGFLYFIDGLTGAGPTTQIFDTNGDGNVDTNDLLVSGVQNKADGRNVTLIVDQNAARTKLVNCSAGDPTCTGITIVCALTNTCVTSSASPIKSRTWRQLFMR